jgi:hypothetical protein
MRLSGQEQPLTSVFQIKENVFEKKYAECLLAKDGSEVIGMALVSFL